MIVNSIGFSGAREKAMLLDAIESHPEWRIARSAEIGAFKGITLEEINSKEIQEAIARRKSEQIFPGLGRIIDDAIEVLKRPFVKKS